MTTRTDVVSLTGGRHANENGAHPSRLSDLFQQMTTADASSLKDEGTTSSEDVSDHSEIEPVDHFVELVLATKENTKDVGWLITDGEDAVEAEINIPFYDTVTEGGNFEEADWKDQPVVRQAKIKWRDDNGISWMERHMEMTQGFILVGESPGLMILGEPTHDREDLSENERCFPDIKRMKGYLIPAGCGMIIKKGTWHDFPLSVGPDVTVFIINTREVVEALGSMKEAAPMDFGDCYKIRTTEALQNTQLRFPDPRPLAKSLGLVNQHAHLNSESIGPQIGGKNIMLTSHVEECSESWSIYGKDMKRVEAGKWGGSHANDVWVVPIVNVERFNPSVFGPSVQPHLNKSHPEIANQGWRDYGNKRGLDRMGRMFKKHGIRCTAVVSSDLVEDNDVMAQLQYLNKIDGWEIGAHGANNSNAGHAGLATTEEASSISNCIERLGVAFGGDKPKTWLTPGFSVSKSTPKLLSNAGLETLLDFVDDDVPFTLVHGNAEVTSDEAEQLASSIVCLPYSMETNDFSLVLSRHLSPREYAFALESHILQLAQESRESGIPTVVCLGMHTFVSGTPAAVNELDKMLSRLKCESNITWATSQDLSICVRKGEKDLIPSQNLVSMLPNTMPTDLLSDHKVCMQAMPAATSQAGKFGLILIDFQNDFLRPGGFGERLGNDTSSLQHVIEPTKEVLSCARLAGLTVIHTREGHRPNLSDLTSLKANNCSAIGLEGEKGRMMVRGDWGNNIVSELKPLSDGSEIVIDKPGKSAFYQTDLELVLKNSGIDTLIVCGVTTEVCVHSTVRDANDRGIKCIVLEDCTASYFNEFHKVGLEMIAAQGGIFGTVSNSRTIIDSMNRIKKT